MSERKRWLVHGRVQGVFFRQSTLQKAEQIGGLEGFVRNLSDGSVEVEVCGPAGDVERLHRFLQRGPPMARVDGVEEVPPRSETELQTFRIR